VAHREVDAALVSSRVTDGCIDEAEEVALDPLSREVVWDRERERLVRQVETLGLGEPGAIGLVVKGGSQTLRNLGPQTLCSKQLLPFHAGWSFLLALPESDEHSTVVKRVQRLRPAVPKLRNIPICRGFRAFHSELHRCGKG
jgi:hypothetical protein